MPTIDIADLEAEARTIIREKIERTPWFSYGMSKEQRQVMIDHEVDRHWHLVTQEAAIRLVDRLAGDCS